jgi:hypothetical protein
MSNGTKSIVHGLVSAVLFAIPLVINLNAPWESLTIGAVLNAIYHYLVAYMSSTTSPQV